MNPKVDFFFNKPSQWQQEYNKLRAIVVNCGLDEQLKWGQPCYTQRKSNIVLIHGFKEYSAPLFFKGALLNDTHGILIRQTENVQSARQVRFTNLEQLTKLEDLLKNYIHEAIEVEKAGLKVELKKTRDFAVAEEFQTKLDELPGLKAAFECLTPGRQRAYLMHFAKAKQAQTRVARIEKYTPHIMADKGMDD